MSYTFTDEDRIKSRDKIFVEACENALKHGTNPGNKFLKKILLVFLKREYICAVCDQLPTWNDKPLNLQVDHINGEHNDNRPENLRFICPNCHSQTETFCGAGNTGNIKVSDEVLIENIKTTPNIRKALMKSGLTPKGGNYVRVRNLIIEHNLDAKLHPKNLRE